MTIIYGLTDEGFVSKPLTVIRDEMNTAFKNAFGISTDLSDRSVLGIIIGIFAERVSLVWEMLETIASSHDPNKATGTLLDSLSALTGTLRAAAAPSTVTLTLTGVDTTVVAAGSRALTVSTQQLFETLDDATLTLVPAWTPSTVYALAARVSNVGNVYQNIQAGTSATSGGPNGTFPDTTTDGTCLWMFLGQGLAAVDAASESVNDGVVVGVARDIAQIATPIGGWQGVINVESADVGRLVATDQELRTLRVLELGSSGSSTNDALIANLLQVENVQSVTLFVNNTDVTDVNGLPPHSVRALIRGGADQDIFDALLANVAAGIATSGNTLGTAIDSQGSPHTVSFSRDDEVPIYVRISLTYDPISYPVDGDAEVATAVFNYGNAQNSGKDVVPTALGAQAFQVTGVLDTTQVLAYTDVIATPTAWLASNAYVSAPGASNVITNDGRTYICITSGTSAGSGGPTGTAVDITDGTAHWRYLGANIIIDPLHRATFLTNNMVITSTAGTP